MTFMNAMGPHDVKLLRDLHSAAQPCDRYHTYIYGCLERNGYAGWDKGAEQMCITDAGRKYLADYDLRQVRWLAQDQARAAQWDAEFAAEHVAEIAGMTNEAARPFLEVAQAAAAEARRLADEAKAACERDAFMEVKRLEQESNKAFHRAREAVEEAARLIMKGII